jgi:quercetin dioxygenase-like cupin family protein
MKIRLREHAKFEPDRMAKIALAATPRVLLDLYALEPGQAQKVHAHDGQDKIYVVLEGRGRFSVGGTEETLEAGEAIVAASGAQHGVVNDSGARLLVLVLVSPPPPHA